MGAPSQCQTYFLEKFFVLCVASSRASAHQHFHAAARAQRNALKRCDDVSRRKIEAQAADKMGERDHRLLQRETHADAHARAGAERQIGVTVDAFAILAEETRGI